MIRGNKKHQLEHSLQVMLWDFAKQVGLSDEYEIQCIVHKFMGRKVASIIDRFGQEKKPHGELGLLRGWIKKRRKTVPTYRPVTSKAQLELLEEFKRQTKLAMNGENILSFKKCDYRDLEEKVEVKVSPTRTKMIPYYCGIPIDYGYEFCRDHFAIVDAIRKEIIEKKKKEDLEENQKLRAQTIDLNLETMSDDYQYGTLGTKKSIVEDIMPGSRELKFEMEFTPVKDETKSVDPDGIFRDMKPFDEDMNTKSRTEKSKHDIANRMMSDDEDDETE